MLWTIYCIVLGFVFVVLKFVNQTLHHMFDTCDMIEESPVGEGSDDAFEKPTDSNVSDLKTDRHVTIQSEYEFT